MQKPESEKEAEPEAPPPPPRENAVLVLGASGRVGRRVVQRVSVRRWVRKGVGPLLGCGPRGW